MMALGVTAPDGVMGVAVPDDACDSLSDESVTETLPLLGGLLP